MRLGACMIAMSVLFAPTIASAQASTAQPSSTDERRLTPQQVEAILADAARKRESGATRVLLEPSTAEEAEPKPQVHGEVGVAIGTGGYREVFGTAIYPLGDDGVAAISLDFTDLGKRRFRR